MLEEDLCQMDCHGLMERLWCLKYEKIVAKMMTNQNTRWNGTVHQDLETWTTTAWRKVYNFPVRSEGMAPHVGRSLWKVNSPIHPTLRMDIPYRIARIQELGGC